MKARRALVVLAATVVALALAPVSRADFGYTFTPTASDVTLGGDVTGPANANSAVKINGASVVAAGALTTGNVLQVNGASSTTYAALNLAGGAGYVTGQLPIGNLGNGTAGQLLITNAGASAGAWTTASGDFTCSTSTPGLCTIANVTAPNAYAITPSATVNTTNATPTTIYTEPSEATATTYDYIVQLGAQNTSATGDWFFAEYRFAYQRNGAGPVQVGTAPIALNLRGSTTGQTYPGLTLSVSSNTVVMAVTGLAATNITWNLQLTRTHVP